MLLLSFNRSIFLQSSNCDVELNAVCRPRCNALAPAAACDADRPGFFRTDDHPRPARPGEDETERWDGLA